MARPNGSYTNNENGAICKTIKLNKRDKYNSYTLKFNLLLWGTRIVLVDSKKTKGGVSTLTMPPMANHALFKENTAYTI
eukprot:snap_masked-scaffold_4-processed-gene-18.44-mRNA-1 protein AED:1.00 eAED:1.00 QI:0/0/0/0/1/1/2/0/78